MYSVITHQDVIIFKSEELKDNKLFISPEIPQLHIIRKFRIFSYLFERDKKTTF